jgi:hemerythrin superfamily protein
VPTHRTAPESGLRAGRVSRVAWAMESGAHGDHERDARSTSFLNHPGGLCMRSAQRNAAESTGRGIRNETTTRTQMEDDVAEKSQDVVELILDDHRRMEELFHRMRSVEDDRAAALKEFSALLIAHGEAEEAEVYPALKRYKNVDDEEVEHGVEEHAEGNKALLALLEVDGVGSDEWDDKLEKLVEAVTHHADEEERTILNGARENVADTRRAELGANFWRVRGEHLKADCGSVDNVRKVVRDS